MSKSSVYLIAVDRIDDTQRAQIQATIKNEAVDWWHQQANVWLVRGGESTATWRDAVAVFLRGENVPGTALVVQLPSMGRRSWATIGLTTDWLKTKFSNEPESVTAITE